MWVQFQMIEIKYLNKSSYVFFFGFPVHIKAMFTVSCSLLSMFKKKTMYIHQLKNTILLTIANHYLSLNLFADSNIKAWGFPGCASGKEPACQCRRLKRCRFDPWVREIPWRRA